MTQIVGSVLVRNEDPRMGATVEPPVRQPDPPELGG